MTRFSYFSRAICISTTFSINVSRRRSRLSIMVSTRAVSFNIAAFPFPTGDKKNITLSDWCGYKLVYKTCYIMECKQQGRWGWTTIRFFFRPSSLQPPSQCWVQMVVVMLFSSMLEINDIVLYCIVFYCKCKYYKQHNKLMAASFARIIGLRLSHIIAVVTPLGGSNVDSAALAGEAALSQLNQEVPFGFR